MKTALTTVVALALGLLAAPMSATAKNFELPDGKPLVTLDLPNAWSPEEIDNGAQATSPDQSIYIAFETANADDTSKAVADTLVWYRKKGVKVDQATQRKAEAKVNGLDVITVSWDGTDKDGPTKLSLSVFVLSPAKIGVLTFWGSPAGERKYAAQLKMISDSIQPLGR